MRCLRLCALLLTGTAFFVTPPITGNAQADQSVDLSGLTAHRNVTVATGPWPPYAMENGLAHGALGQIIEVIFNRAGYGVDFRFQPWPRSLKDSLDGTADAVMPAYCSAQRSENYYCSDSIITGEMVFFRRTDTAPVSWTKLSDLKDIPIGATQAYYYGAEFEAAEASGEITVIRIPSDFNNMNLLLKKRIKLYPQDARVGDEMIRQHFPLEKQKLLTHDNKPIHTQPIHVLFTRANARGEQLTRIFNDGLSKLKESGELAELLVPLSHDHHHKHE